MGVEGAGPDPAGGWPPMPSAPPGPPGPPVPAAPPGPARGGAHAVLLVVAGLLVGLVVGGTGGFLVGRALGDSGTITIGDGGGGSSAITEPDPPSQDSTRDEPVALGTPVDLGNGWTLAVLSFDPSPPMDDGIEPPAGRQWVVAELEATYVEGDEDATSPFFAIDLSFVGPSGVAATSTDAACFAPEPEFDNLGDVYLGGTVTGNYCVAVPVDDVDGLVMVAEPAMTFDGTKTYFALR